MKTLASLIESHFGETDVMMTPPLSATSITVAPSPVRERPRGRRKLWQLPTHRHCTLIGTCLPVIELRKLAMRAGFDLSDMSDYTLHTVAIGHCAHRTGLAEAIQRFFEKRYAPSIARFSAARDAQSVANLWREALAGGAEIPGALWAAWTHGLIDDDTEKQIFGDIHMLSHQIGASARADLRELDRHKDDAAHLRKENEALRRGMIDMQHTHDKTLNQIQRELAIAEQRAASYAQRELILANAAIQHQQFVTLQQRALALAERAETLEERNAENARRAARLELGLLEAREELKATEEALATALGICDGISGTSGCGKTCPVEQALIGRCVLCIGGRTGLVDGYRKLVEVRGGRFLHHDGGQEESLHRIDAAVAAADAVVCQSGCVSHAAYWRLKDVCKKLNKPCVFVQSPGVGSFARSLNAISSAAPGTQVIRFPL
jgi:hypothetical protein